MPRGEWGREPPEPAVHRENPFDYEHYIDKQLRPVAEPDLKLLHKSFDELAGGHQMGLF